MNSPSSQRGSRLRTDPAQSKLKGAVNKLCTKRQQGLDVGTKISDFPVEGEVFQDFPHFFVAQGGADQQFAVAIRVRR